MNKKEQTEFEVKLTETVKRKVKYSRVLRPEDFLDVRDVSRLKYEIEHKLKYRDKLTEDGHYIRVDNYNYDILDVINSELQVPYDFIQKWKELLGMENLQVVNPKYVPELKKRSTDTESIPGYALQKHLCTSSYSEYTLPKVYFDAYFDEKKTYKCYISYDDHDWGAPTQTIIHYIEGF